MWSCISCSSIRVIVYVDMHAQMTAVLLHVESWLISLLDLLAAKLVDLSA